MHYRNQQLHGLLDRRAALELLNWGVFGKIAPALSASEQWRCFNPLVQILEMSGYTVQRESDGIGLCGKTQKRNVHIYPAMWAEPNNSEMIHIPDVWLKFAKPYALQKLEDSIK